MSSFFMSDVANIWYIFVGVVCWPHPILVRYIVSSVFFPSSPFWYATDAWDWRGEERWAFNVTCVQSLSSPPTQSLFSDYGRRFYFTPPWFFWYIIISPGDMIQFTYILCSPKKGVHHDISFGKIVGRWWNCGHLCSDRGRIRGSGKIPSVLWHNGWRCREREKRGGDTIE